MDFKPDEYTHALVGKVTPLADYGDGVEYEGVRRQHNFYTGLLKEANMNVIEVDMDGCPHTRLFIDNMAIVCQGVALLPRNSTVAEINNTKILKDIFQNELGHTVIDQVESKASISCADVLYTGREIFVGISEHTNEAGAEVVARSFPEFPCSLIREIKTKYYIKSVGDVTWHNGTFAARAFVTQQTLIREVPRGEKALKDYITMAGPDILCVSSSKEGTKVIKRIEREATYVNYRTLTVPEEEAANCLYVNGTLIHRAIEEVPQSFKVFCEKIHFPRRSICFSEIAKIPGNLSACSLLTRKY